VDRLSVLANVHLLYKGRGDRIFVLLVEKAGVAGTTSSVLPPRRARSLLLVRPHPLLSKRNELTSLFSQISMGPSFDLSEEGASRRTRVTGSGAEVGQEAKESSPS
jgi:hypothetical protein